MNFYLFLIALIFGLSTCSFGTCIVVYRTNSKVYIGADSRRILDYYIPGTNKTTHEVHDDFCKISTYKAFTYAIAGFDDAALHQITSTAVKGSTDPINVLRLINNGVKLHYEQKIESLRSSGEYFKSLHNRGRIAEIAVVFFVNKVAMFHHLIFEIVSPINNKVIIKVIDNSNIPGVNQILKPLGLYNGMQKLDFFKVMADVDKAPLVTIRNLIQLESKTSQEVGGPIDVILVTENKAVWLAKKKNCN